MPQYDSIFTAIENRNLKAVMDFVVPGFAINGHNKDGETPLHRAALRGDLSNNDIIEGLDRFASGSPDTCARIMEKLAGLEGTGYHKEGDTQSSSPEAA